MHYWGMDRPALNEPRALDEALERCETLMLDMDGTVLDLAYDNFMWLTRVPEAYAEVHGLSGEEARQTLFSWFRQMRGTLDWYCMDQWSERLKLDVVALHHEHRDRIDYLPGARNFLETVAQADIRVLLVTNSHRSTLDLKADVTGLDRYFDQLYTSHDLGFAKEDRDFWGAIREEEKFDPGTTLFVDDTLPVLESANDFGIRHLRQVTRPDTSRPRSASGEFSGIESVRDLLRLDEA
jgi:HAD superfamily hydrolase (TIGR01509 family)